MPTHCHYAVIWDFPACQTVGLELIVHASLLLPPLCVVYCVFPWCRLQTGTIFTVNLNTVSSRLRLLLYLHFLRFWLYTASTRKPLLTYDVNRYSPQHLMKACTVLIKWCDVPGRWVVQGCSPLIHLFVSYHHSGTVFDGIVESSM